MIRGSPHMMPHPQPMMDVMTLIVYYGWLCTLFTLTVRPGKRAGMCISWRENILGNLSSPNCYLVIPLTFIVTFCRAYRNRLLGTRNDSSVESSVPREAGEDVIKKELNIPHRRPIHYPREPVVLKWEDTPKTSTAPA